LKNQQTGETVYTPPQDHEEILSLMANLERFINDDTFYEADPLVKMAMAHYQFESIHPFYDGNGRTGRIMNVLYLALKGLLDIPVLYLSRYIVESKPDYYRLLHTKIEFIERDLNVKRITATKYLDALVGDNLLKKEKLGRTNYYINTALYTILTNTDIKS
jgi:Fic family protein